MSAITSVIVIIITHFLVVRQEAAKLRADEKKLTAQSHINPLRFYLSEVYFRIVEIRNGIKEQNDKIKALRLIESPGELSGKSMSWFNADGCYLASTCYLTACLFHSLSFVKQKLAYLHLISKSDTIMLGLIIAVNVAFSKYHGVYYIIQHNIADEMFADSRDRIISYKDFCLRITKNDSQPWFERLVQFYIEIGRSGQLSRIDEILIAIEHLSDFLDELVDGSNSLCDRLRPEGINRPCLSRTPKNSGNGSL